MKICVYGAGAIGGYLGVELARAGADVSLVARGAHLAAMRANGLKLPMEIDPPVTVVQEMGRLTGIPTPALDAVLALVAQRAGVAGLYQDNVRPADIKAPAFA
jgi:ketopantoate reductase